MVLFVSIHAASHHSSITVLTRNLSLISSSVWSRQVKYFNQPPLSSTESVQDFNHVFHIDSIELLCSC